MQITIASWNIWGGMFLPDVYKFLIKTDADIVALQEAEESDNTNTAEVIAKSLGYACVYTRSMGYEHDGKRSYRGNAVLSKFPIVQSTPHILSSQQSRTAVQADIMVGDRVLHVVSVHLIHSHQKESSLQEEQAKNLINAVPKERTVIMGDFNALPESRAIQVMRKVFKDADLSGEPTWCLYPDGCEVCKPDKVQWKLDYMFCTPDITVSDFAVGDSRGSDHLPIVGTLT